MVVLLLALSVFAYSEDCRNIGINGTIYSDTVLSEDLYSSGDCLLIGADNITLDCAGHGITGDGTGIGVYAIGRNGITVRNCRVEKFNYGLRASYSGSSLFEKNAVSDCYAGTYASSSSSLVFSENKVNSNTIGLYAYDLSSSSIKADVVKNNKEHGLEMRFSFGNEVKDNDFSGNRIGAGVYSTSETAISGNDLRGCYVGYKEESSHSIRYYGNSEDVISGSGWDRIFSEAKSVLAIALLIVLFAGLAVFLGMSMRGKFGR
jgi:parallel beta-helix repeat protein